MMMIQSVLRAVALTLERSHNARTPRKLLSLFNEAVENNLKQIGSGQYMTITAMCIEERIVSYAGLHQDLLIYRAARQQVEHIESQGGWLEVLEGEIRELLEDAELRLEEGDVMLLCTDGYTKAQIAGRLFETAGLSAIFGALCERMPSIPAVLTGLLAPLKQAVVGDDVTLVALRRLDVPTAVR